MSTNLIDKIKIKKSVVEKIADEYIKERVDELLPKYYNSLVDIIKAKRSNSRYVYFKDKDIYYDFETGNIFLNPYSKANVEDTIFSKFKYREMTDEEKKNFRVNYPKENSNKIYVDCGVEESGDGKSWDTAFKTINEAINTYKDNDEIIVASGIYAEALTLKSNMSIHGGYKAGETNLFLSPSDETIITRKVLLQSIQNVTLSYLVHMVPKGQQCALDIRDTTNFKFYSLRVRNNNFEGNSNYLKAIYINNSNGKFYNSRIEANSVRSGSSSYIYGGGIYICDSNIDFIKCLFKNNSNKNTYISSYEYGGAILLCRGNYRVVNCHFENNSAYYGPDIFNYDNSNIKIVGNQIKNYNNVSYIDYKNLDIDLKNEIEELEYNKPIYKLVENVESDKDVLNTLVINEIILLYETSGQNTFLKENFSLKDGFLIDKIYKKLLKNEFDLNLYGEILSKKAVVEKFLTGEIKIPNEMIENLLLNCDSKRIAITPYDKKILQDISRGHWELWDNNQDGDIEIVLENKLVARDPKLDINYNGIVAIDFGTKSTVVVYQKDDDTTYIKRIGAGNLQNDVESKDYENPTVLEFRNLEKFLDDYRASSARPKTCWEDLTSSYTAQGRLLDGTSDEFYTVFADLKQWAAGNKKKIIKDKSKNSYELKEFFELNLDEDINPIEIYAYYIGLAINNMHGDGIFIDYILSFPVKYEANLCERIRESFEKGLKKSLPLSVLEDAQVMKNFKVRIGATEPAAYAVCALQEYGFEPEGDEEIKYGIFDFGGGTTDFDFGVWREPKKGSYDFEIEHFYDNGDKYLGGENMLQLLAYEIFKNENNQDVLKSNQITFTLPPECIAYAGSETLIVNSQEAELNMKKMMEACRYFWEHNGENFVNPEEATNYEGQILTIGLYSRDGKLKNCELTVDEDRLREVIKSRIEKGVKNFFESWRMATNDMGKIDKFYIFLAGNSSKSKFVKEIFERYIEEFSKDVETDKPKETFVILPPLGTDEAKVIQEENGGSIYEEIIEPTGKTGVAYGLIRSRESGKIKVIKRKTNEFKFFVGIERRRKFKMLMNRDVELNKWVEFMAADRKEFEIFYTELPEAISGELLVKNVKKIHCEIEEANEDKNIYVRATSNNTIEYTAASEDEIAKKDYDGRIYKKELV